jgi:hypothetical protein
LCHAFYLKTLSVKGLYELLQGVFPVAKKPFKTGNAGIVLDHLELNINQ